MPTHQIHLAIAIKVNKRLNLDLDRLMLGSVLPDLTINKDHSYSHFQKKGTYEGQLANPDKFLKKYKKNIDNPIVVGVLIHLLTDRYYNDYYFKNHCIFDENKIPVSVKLKNGKIYKPIKNPKHSDFYKYDKWLFKNNYIKKFMNTDFIEEVERIFPNEFDLEYIKKYIEKSNKNKIKDFKTNMFYKTMTKKELDEVFNSCIDYILNYIEEVL